MPAHETVEMVYHGRSNKKHTHHGNRGTRELNHWFSVYRCPICGRTKSHKRKPYKCNGIYPAPIAYSAQVK